MNVVQYIKALTQINQEERNVSSKLLIHILGNILKYPHDNKYRNLNWVKISKRLEKCQIGIDLLFSVGFQKSDDGKRLILDNNKMLNTVRVAHLLQIISNNITEHSQVIETNTLVQLLNDGYTSQEAKQAIHMNMNNKNMPGTYTNDLQTLIEMGFTEQMAIQAMHKCNNDICAAIQSLLSIDSSSINHADQTEMKHSEFFIPTGLVLMPDGRIVPETNTNSDSNHIQSKNFKVTFYAPKERLNKHVENTNNIKENNTGMNLSYLLEPNLSRIKHEQHYDKKVVNQLLQLGTASRDQIIKASSMTKNFTNANDVFTTLHDVIDILSDDEKQPINDVIEITPTYGCILSKCKPMKRMTDALFLYQSFIVCKQQKNNLSDVMFEEMQIEYDIVSALNDFHHLLYFHQHEFEDIYTTLVTTFGVCSLFNCYILKRNHRDRSLLRTQNYDEEIRKMYFHCGDNKIALLQQTLDRLHCHYLHSFDIGYRLFKTEQKEIRQFADKYNNEELKQDDNTYSVLLQQISKRIINRQKVRKNIQGLERLNNTDKFVNTIDYNTELRYSYGYRFFYWDYYKNNKDTQDPARGSYWINYQDSANPGHVLSDFYVESKFSNIKQELLTNPICIINQSQWAILVHKAIAHADTDHFRSLKCLAKNVYGIKIGLTISNTHLLAMMVYCNQDELQRKFSETFRKISADETIDSLIKRHSNYAHLGRLLRECVECFSICFPYSFNDDRDCIDISYKDSNIFEQRLYHGISIQSNFASVYGYINGPVSTTTEFSCAVNFCAHAGMILEFKLDLNWCCNSAGVSMFDCKYLSDYSNESEIFLIGGYSRLFFQSIIDAPTGFNYEYYVQALTAISDFCFGKKAHGKFNDVIAKICFRIISHKLHICYPNDPKYVECKLIPLYVQKLTEAHFSTINRIIIFQHFGYIILQKMFKKLVLNDNGWIKIKLLMQLFPALEQITFLIQNKNDVFVQNMSIYESVLLFLTKQTSSKLQRIRVWIPNKKNVLLAANNICGLLNDEFKKSNWKIFVNTSNHSVNSIDMTTENVAMWMVMESVNTKLDDGLPHFALQDQRSGVVASPIFSVN